MKHKVLLKYFCFLILISSVLIFSKCGNEAEVKVDGQNKNAISLDNVRFLEGTWVDSKTFGFKNPPQHFVEIWKSYPDSMSGIAYMVIESDSSLMERVSIVMINEKLTYIARPKNQSLVSFTLINDGKESFIFENKANDYPQQLIYKSVSKDSLYITMDGISKGIPRTITFKYEKK
jgi:hypothetical protein